MPDYSNIFNSFLNEEEKDKSKEKNLYDNVFDSFMSNEKDETVTQPVDINLSETEEPSRFDKWATKVRKYTPNFLLTEREKALKGVEKAEEIKIEKERVLSDDFVNDKNTFTNFLKGTKENNFEDGFLSDEENLKSKLGTDNLAAVDLKQDLGDLTKIIREDLGIAGRFGTDTRTQYPSLTNEDIDSIIKNEFYNKVKDQKLDIADRQISISSQDIIDGGGDIGDEVGKFEELDIQSFDNPERKN